MAISKTTNPKLEPVTTKLHPGKAFNVLCGAFTAARNSALTAAYSVVVFLFNVNAFRDAKDKDYRGVDAAVKYIREELEAQTDVKGGMLDRYVSIGANLYSKLKDARFADLHAKLAALTDKNAAEGPEIVQTFMKNKTGVDTFSDLMRQLGYSTGHDKPRETTPVNPEQRAANLVDTVKEIAKQLHDKSDKTPRAATKLIAQSVAAAVPDPVELARQAITRITDPEELLDLIQWANKLVDTLSDKIEAAEKAEAKTAAKAKAKAKTGKARTQAATA